MPCYFHHMDASCALGDSLTNCLQNLKLQKIQPSRIKIERSNESVEMAYFNAPNPEAFQTAQLMDLSTFTQIKNALDTTGLSQSERQRTGLFIGSSSFSMSHSEDQSTTSKPILSTIGYAKRAYQLAQEFGLSEHAYAYATACTSSANALLYAQRFIRQGFIDHALVMGYEFFNKTTALGFKGLELISPTGSIKPFDINRDGIVLGEGCATILLSREHKQDTAQLLGGACNTDHYSLTAANVDGSTIANVMTCAMNDSAVTNNQIRAIKVHGTASLMNDEAESAGIRRLFNNQQYLFALKPFIGHTLGACGAIETTITAGALSAGWLPENATIKTDGKLGISLNQSHSEYRHGVVLLNYFAFGGNNTCLAVAYPFKS